MEKTYDLFIETEKGLISYFKTTTGKPLETDRPYETLYYNHKEIYNLIYESKYKHYVLRQFTPFEIAKYLYENPMAVLDIEGCEISISYNMLGDCLDALENISEDFDITVSAKLTKGSTFEKICESLASQLNQNIVDYWF
jgi:hypothetical protein